MEKSEETKMHPSGLSELGGRITAAAKSLIKTEAKKLKHAVENGNAGYTPREEESVELLVKAGLLKHVGTSESTRNSEHIYQATNKGKQVYDLIFKN